MLNESMKKKMGRPRLAKTAKDVLIGARFGVEEAKKVEESVKKSGKSKSAWIREKLLDV